MSKDNGGPAFPIRLNPGERYDSHCITDGMTLRDYFAAKAMAALISTAGGPCVIGLGGCEPATASAAYKIADAMLAEREKSQ